MDDLQISLRSWMDAYPKAAKEYYRRKAREIKDKVRAGYTGTVGVRTGALRASVGYKANRYGFLVSVKSGRDRRHVARLIESGYKHYKHGPIAAKEVWSPIKAEFEMRVADELADEIMRAYR